MLNLYLGITPNYESTHYYFRSFSRYKSFLASKLLKQIDPSAFTINYNRVRVRIDNTLTINNYKSVTYIVNTDDEKCYLVNNAVVQSGYVDFNITVDNWGTYISKASFKDILVQRCNRKISNNGIYDIIKNDKDISRGYIGYGAMELSNLTMVFQVYMNDGSSAWRGLYTLGVNAQTIYDTIIQTHPEITNPYAIYGLLFLAQNTTDYKLKIDNDDYKTFKLINVYLLPNELVDLLTSTEQFILKGGYITQTVNVQRCALKEKTTTKTINVTDLNKKYIVGSYDNGINVNIKTNNTIEVTYGAIINDSKITVYVSDGTNIKDISASFQLETETSTSEQYSNSGIQKVLQGTGQALSSAIGVAFSALSKRYNKIGISAFDIFSSAGDTPSIPSSTLSGIGSSGVNSYYLQNSAQVGNPYKYRYATSLIDENEKARKTGATFNEYISNIANIFNYSLLGTGATDDDTFVIIDAEIEAIPLDATNEIRDKLKNGVYLQQLL